MDIGRLDAVPLLAGLPFTDRAAIAALAREARADAGDVLVRDGNFLYELMAIESGAAKRFCAGRLVEGLTAGDVVGEIGCLERQVGTTTVVACTTMRLLTLSAVDVRRLRHNDPAVVARVQGKLLRRRNRAAR
jgi:CRP-like cAMP-binding protein